MTLADELYARGEQLYRDRDYAAAERAFRELMTTLPPTDGKGLGRAAYSIGLCAMKQGRSAEARVAFEAALAHEPGMDRARERLAQLDAHDDENQVEGLEGHILGIATNVQMSVAPHAVISTARTYTLQFRLQVPGATQSPAVTMRGPKLRGSIAEGDEVAVPDSWRPGKAPRHVVNLSTGETVRVARGVRTAQVVTLALFIALIVAFIVFVVMQMGGDRLPR